MGAAALKFEPIDDNGEDPGDPWTRRTVRAAVPGGWIVRSVAIHTHPWAAGRSDFAVSESSVFVPDPDHKWGQG